MGIKGRAEHIGKSQFLPSKEWAKYNSPKSFAKTDIKIGTHKISLKSANDHILLSAKRNEAIATFMNVSEILYKNKVPEIVKDVVNSMNNMITTGVSPTTITKAKKLGEPIIKDAEQNHGEILHLIEKVFEDASFYTLFIKEVLSGELKFGKNSDAAATHILYITHKPILHSLSDLNYISEIAGNIDIRIDFKSVKKIGMGSAGKYRYWSVIQAISKHLIQESSVYEANFLSKAYSWILTIFTDIKQSITSWSDLFNFMDVDPTIIIDLK